jgi:hypothetical protein
MMYYGGMLECKSDDVLNTLLINCYRVTGASPADVDVDYQKIAQFIAMYTAANSEEKQTNDWNSIFTQVADIETVYDSI